MVRVRKLTDMRTSCPAQWTAETFHGEDVYIRYRWGWITVYVGGKDIYTKKCGADYAGTMDTKEMKRVLKNVIKEMQK